MNWLSSSFPGGSSNILGILSGYLYVHHLPVSTDIIQRSVKRVWRGRVYLWDDRSTGHQLR